MHRIAAVGFLSAATVLMVAVPAYAAPLPDPTVAVEVTGNTATVAFAAPDESSWCGNAVMPRGVADTLLGQLDTFSPGEGFAFPEDRVWPTTVSDEGAMIDGGETSTVTISNMNDGKYSAVTVCSAFHDGEYQFSYSSAQFQIGGVTGSLGSVNLFDLFGS